MSYLPDAGANAIIANVIEGFDREIGSSIVAYYLIGSHVDGSAVPLSDVDMVVLLDPSAGHLLAQAGTLSRSLQHQHGCLDLVIGTPEMFAGPGWLRFAPALKRRSLLLQGSDIAATIPDPEQSAWSVTVAGVWRRDAKRVRGLDVIASPLGYPDPADEFRGYIERVPSWAPSGVACWTHPLVVMVSMGATAILAIEAGIQVAARSEVVPAFRSLGGAWASFVEDVDARCRGIWLYHVPDNTADRDRLRGWCDAALEFEEHCLQVIVAHDARRGTTS